MVRRLGLTACVVMALAPRDAAAWGTVGHRASAIVAEARLTPAARSKVRELLDPDETLAAASLWADEHRRDVPGSGAWHYVNVPLDEVHYDPRFCPATGCVVSKIHELRTMLTNDAAPRDERRQALRLLVHLVEDLHQPLHVGNRNDRGGNDLQVQFFGRGTNLHRLWDDDIVERHSTEESTWVAELDALAKTDAARAWTKGTVESWADESLALARRAYASPGSAEPLRPGAKLGQDYFDDALPAVRRRLAQAAVRLASMLNEIFQTGQTR
jgi:nuclease S1